MWDRARFAQGLPLLTADRHTFVNESSFVDAYWADVASGLLDFDAHAWPQTRCAARLDGAATVVGRLDRAQSAFEVFRRAAGLPQNVRFPAARLNRGAADDALAGTFSPAAWDAFCGRYREDYVCLGFAPPGACRDRWRYL